MTDIIDQLRSALSGQYDVQRQIGQGGMATVFLARDLKHQREVAIKVLRSELSATIGADRFNREVEIAARLQHPHILPVYDSGSAGDALYYVMPFVEGESLKERLEQGTVSAAEALRIGREVASALDYAHRQGVVHRDIKPANILISQGHAVVADFGIARAAGASAPPGRGLTQIGMTVGTPWYMSPEQAVADPAVDGRSDVYALGCVLYEMLEGRPPFDAESAHAVIAKTISAPIPEMTRATGDLPRAVPAAIRRALAKNPDDRFQTAGELERALEYSTGSPALARGRRTNSAFVYAAAGIAIVLAALAGFSFRGISGSSVAEGADLIAVLPFDVSGADPDLSEGMVTLLSTNLNAVGTLRTVDARTVLQRWRSRGGESGLDLENSLSVGRDVNAGSVLIGSVVQAGDGVRLTAQLLGVAGKELARVQIDGDASDIISLVDALSLEVLHEVWRSNEPMPSFDVAAITSGSIDAVRAYVRGRAYLRRGQWDSAEAAYQQAIAFDSTFALAHLELSETYGWTGHGGEPQIEAAARAAKHADRLPPREQFFVTASELYRRNEPGAIDSMRAYTRRYPSDPRGWYALGDAQHHSRGKVLLSPDEEMEPFDRAIALDSSYVTALVHPMEISLRAGKQDLFRTYLSLTLDAGGSDRGLPLAEAAVWGDSASSAAAWDSLFETNMSAAQMALAAALTSAPEALTQGMDVARRRYMDDPNLMDMRYGYAMVALATGQIGEYEKGVSELEAHDLPGIRALGGLMRVLAVLAGQKPRSFADSEGLNTLLRDQSAGAPAFVESLLALSKGDTGPARAFVEAAPTGSENGRHMLRGTAGWIALIEGDTATGIVDLQMAIDSMPATELGGDQVRNILYFQLARTLAMQRETHEEGMKRLAYGLTLMNAPELLPAAHLAAAQASESMGNVETAIEWYSKFVQLWEQADAELQPRVEEARNAVTRLTRQIG
jgi:serine/threonine-protein kinase